MNKSSEFTWLIFLPALLASVWVAGCTPPFDLSAVTPVPENAAPEYPPLVELEFLVDAGTMITSMTNAGDGSGRLFLTTRRGEILIIRDGRLQRTPFLDLRSRVDSLSIEQGLLGLAFDPDYVETGEFYVYYTNQETEDDTVVARYRVSSEDPDRANPNAHQQILFVRQPANNHNAGHLLFGEDGYLYIALGDGGPGNDRRRYAQNPGELLGKILRLDVRGQETYAIPPDNPFVDDPDYRPEIWALGMRNPWRFTFDPVTGSFFMGDVGQEQWEELNIVAEPGSGGMNFGWNILEGYACFSPKEGCRREGLVHPIYVYRHGKDGCSITGGEVYHGRLFPRWEGAYFFSDFCTGLIRGAWMNDAGEWVIQPLLETGLAVVSFGADEDGELYILDLKGEVFRLVEGE